MNVESAACKLGAALSMTETLFPNAVTILTAMDVRLDERVTTAAVTSSGRMLISPKFLDTLTVQQTVFIIAHELYHILYGVFDRFDSKSPPHRRWLVNVAHDFIVNDMLEKKFAADSFNAHTGKLVKETSHPNKSKFIPSDGLFWADYAESYKRIVGQDQPPLETFSLESLVFELERISSVLPPGNPLDRMMRQEHSHQPWGTSMGGLLDQLQIDCCDDSNSQDPSTADNSQTPSDDSGNFHDLSDILSRRPELLTDDEEAELFPDETAVERNSKRERIQSAKELSSTRNAMEKSMNGGHGFTPGDGNAVVHALEGSWDTPWERALQKWLDDTTPPVRTWAKASRRAGNRTDVVLPGRLSDGYILNIVVDTSGSMADILPAAFGMIHSFGKNSGVHAVRIIQCDADVTADDTIDIDSITEFNVKGFGGSDMSPGLLRLADDPNVEAALVLTDGYIEYPPKEKIPFDVLWCIFDWDASDFDPGYGDVIIIPPEQFQSN